MAKLNRTQLSIQAQQIATETSKKANTAAKVGGLDQDIIDSYVHLDDEPLYPPVHKHYADIPGMLGMQGEQQNAHFYFVLNAAAAGFVGHAYYEYKGVANGLISDYYYVSSEPGQPISTATFTPQISDPPHEEGLVFFDKMQEMFSGYNELPDVKMTFGRELWKRGINKTGGLLTDGSIVKSGPVDVTSDRPTVLLVGAGDVAINDTLGFLTHDVDDDAECEVTTFGDLHGLNTIGFAEGVLYLSVTPGEWSNTPPELPNATVNMGRFEKIHADDGRIFVRIIPPQIPKESSFNPSFSSFGTGTRYVTGGYLFGASNFTPSGTPQPLGTANVAHGMHAFLVLGANSTDMVVRVTGTSYLDEDGIRTPGDTVDIDTSGLSTNDYIETPEKWIGQVNYTLLSGTGVAVNYGFAKYWDNKDKPFIITQIEWDGEAGFNDANADVLFYHHSSSGWTYNAGSTPTQAAAIASMKVDYSTESQIASGLKFNYKKTGLGELIAGDEGEGLITAIIVGNANSIASSNFDIKFIE